MKIKDTELMKLVSLSASFFKGCASVVKKYFDLKLILILSE